MCFEEMSRLKINYHNSEGIVMGHTMEVHHRVADMLNCKLGAFPFVYHGLPISNRKLTLDQWLFLVRRLGVKIATWLGRFLSSGGRLILSNSCLSSLPMFSMGLFLLQDGVHSKFDSHHSRFFWDGSRPECKFHLVNWPAICRPKEAGGLGILNSRKMNIALMLKWVWKLYQGDNALWS
jgi:hypothetical protein